MDKEGLKKSSPGSHTWEGGGPAGGDKRKRGRGSQWIGLCSGGDELLQPTKKTQCFYNLWTPPFCEWGSCTTWWGCRSGWREEMSNLAHCKRLVFVRLWMWKRLYKTVGVLWWGGLAFSYMACDMSYFPCHCDLMDVEKINKENTVGCLCTVVFLKF